MQKINLDIDILEVITKMVSETNLISLNRRTENQYDFQIIDFRAMPSAIFKLRFCAATTGEPFLTTLFFVFMGLSHLLLPYPNLSHRLFKIQGKR